MPLCQLLHADRNLHDADIPQPSHADLCTFVMQERESHASTRESAAKLQADLTELQTVSTVAAAQAAADKVSGVLILLDNASQTGPSSANLACLKCLLSDSDLTFMERFTNASAFCHACRCRSGPLQKELERLRREIGEVSAREETAADEVARLRSEVMQLR